ncbi:MAG: protoheme IX farnesyltransferase [Chloroflexi bacterium]|nr:protoheme IX farnesyltransferase [Chloroflexota bacterium]
MAWPGHTSKTACRRTPVQAASVAVRRLLSDYLALTKPNIVVLLLLTALAGAVLAARGLPPAAALAAVLIGGAMAAGGAGALNHYLERDLDSAMSRTRHRPLPGQRIPPGHALLFGLALNLGAFLLFATLANLLSAALALAGALFYLLVYTHWLKRSTPQNIVIGGAAGALPPLVGWAAVMGGVELPAIYLFAIIFFWTPPHFWALALLLRDDYARAGVPMLPVVQGEHATAWQILLYSLVVVALTVLLFTTRRVGWLYLALALALGALFIIYAVQLLRDIRPARARRLYKYSLLYLALIFVAVIVDGGLIA